jgi:hypothetical protein
MGDALDQDMLGVESAGDGELQVGPGFPASSPAVGKLRICDAAANQEATVKVTFRPQRGGAFESCLQLEFSSVKDPSAVLSLVLLNLV